MFTISTVKTFMSVCVCVCSWQEQVCSRGQKYPTKALTCPGQHAMCSDILNINILPRLNCQLDHHNKDHFGDKGVGMMVCSLVKEWIHRLFLDTSCLPATRSPQQEHQSSGDQAVLSKQSKQAPPHHPLSSTEEQTHRCFIYTPWAWNSELSEPSTCLVKLYMYRIFFGDDIHGKYWFKLRCLISSWE